MLIPKGAIIVAEITSNDKARPNLQLVQIERDATGRPAMYATDGHRAIAVSWEEFGPDEWPAPVIASAERVEGYAAKIHGDDLLRVQKNIPKPDKDSLPAIGCALLEEKHSAARFHTTDLHHHTSYETANCADVETPDLATLLKPRAAQKGDMQVAVSASLFAGLIEAVSSAAASDTVVLSVSKSDGLVLRLSAVGKAYGRAAVGQMAPANLDEDDWKAHVDALGSIKTTARQ